MASQTKFTHYVEPDSATGRVLDGANRKAFRACIDAALYRYLRLSKECRPSLDVEQWVVLCFILQGTMIHDDTCADELASITAEHDEADRYADTFRVTLDPLVKAIRRWSTAECIAAVDVIDRFWVLAEAHKAVPAVALLEDVLAEDIAGITDRYAMIERIVRSFARETRTELPENVRFADLQLLDMRPNGEPVCDRHLLERVLLMNGQDPAVALSGNCEGARIAISKWYAQAILAGEPHHSVGDRIFRETMR